MDHGERRRSSREQARDLSFSFPSSSSMGIEVTIIPSYTNIEGEGIEVIGSLLLYMDIGSSGREEGRGNRGDWVIITIYGHLVSKVTIVHEITITVRVNRIESLGKTRRIQAVNQPSTKATTASWGSSSRLSASLRVATAATATATAC